MKVVHIFWSLTYGGIETMLVNIANKQVMLGTEVHVVIINDVIDETLARNFEQRIHVHCLKRKLHSKNPIFALKLNLLLRGVDPDAIHLHRSEIIQLIFNKNLRRKSSVTIHDLPSGETRPRGICRVIPMLNWFATSNVMCIDKIPRVFAISQAVHDELINKYRVESVIVCNGISTSRFAQRSLNTFESTFRIVQVSRIAYKKKGQDILIKAVAKIKDNVFVDFIGEGESMEYLKKLALELKIENRIRFLGKRDQMYISTHLKDYDLFVQPSRIEGFGLTVAEAMAANVPVLVSAGQGPAEVTCGNIFGWTFENGIIDDLAAKIDYIRTNYNEALNKVQAAHQHVVDNYDVSVTARKYLESYNK